MKSVFKVCLGVLLLSAVAPVLAQSPSSFSTKPVRIIVPFTAGSGADADSRFYGQLLGKRLQMSVVVENRPGASGVIAVRAVKTAPADGHTLLIATSSPMAVNSVTMKDLPYDPFVDFKPLVGVAVNPASFIVKADSPYRNLQDLVAAAKAAQRPIAIGDYSAGYQLMAAWLGNASGVGITHISYKGGAQMVADVLGGQLELAVTDPSAIVELHKEKKIRVIATTGDKRMDALADAPTMIESGFTGYETYIWSSFFVRDDTSPEVTTMLIDALAEVMQLPEAQAYRSSRGQTLLDLKGEDMRAFQRKEFGRFKRVAEAVRFQKQ